MAIKAVYNYIFKANFRVSIIKSYCKRRIILKSCKYHNMMVIKLQSLNNFRFPKNDFLWKCLQFGLYSDAKIWLELEGFAHSNIR